MLRSQATKNLLRRSVVRSTCCSTNLATRAASTHAISNPTLANIDKRWEGMPLQEQADLWMALRDRMQGNWKELTVQEQKAGALCFPFSLILLSPHIAEKYPRNHPTVPNKTTSNLDSEIGRLKHKRDVFG